MGVRTFKPTSPSRRHMTVSDFADLTEKGNEPERSLTAPMIRSGGRNNQGRTAVRFRGGTHKRRYRIIDFKRNKLDVPAKVAGIEYDPNRSARIALLHYADGEKRYILAPLGLQKGTVIVSSSGEVDVQPGNSMLLKSIPMGTSVHNIELKAGKGGQLVRAAGGTAQIMAREGGFVLLRLPSGELRRIHEVCRATVGQLGNTDHGNLNHGKAGKTRWLGKRPHNRGVSMNPVDHPLGGGEGKSSGGRNPVTPWGKPTRGMKTRKNKKASSQYIVARRSAKKRG